jgi:hypothetical protein
LTVLSTNNGNNANADAAENALVLSVVVCRWSFLIVLVVELPVGNAVFRTFLAAAAIAAATPGQPHLGTQAGPLSWL